MFIIKINSAIWNVFYKGSYNFKINQDRKWQHISNNLRSIKCHREYVLNQAPNDWCKKSIFEVKQYLKWGESLQEDDIKTKFM